MDRYDPNEWTKSFVSENETFCLEQLRSTNNRVIELIQQGDYAPAVAGLDRILNGLVTMLNAGGDYRSQICFFSWIEAHIILFGVDGPEDQKRNNALNVLEDARDFAKSDSTKQTLSSMISDLRSGQSVYSLKQEYDPAFPTTDIETLSDLNSKLVSTTHSSNTNYSTSSESSSGCGSGCFTIIIIIAIIVGAIYFGMMYFTKDKEMTPIPTPADTESSLYIDTINLDC